MIKQKPAKNLHAEEGDVCVKYYMWGMEKTWLGKRTLRLCGAILSNDTSVLVHAWTEDCELKVCLAEKKLTDNSGVRVRT